MAFGSDVLYSSGIIWYLDTGPWMWIFFKKNITNKLHIMIHPSDGLGCPGVVGLMNICEHAALCEVRQLSFLCVLCRFYKHGADKQGMSCEEHSSGMHTNMAHVWPKKARIFWKEPEGTLRNSEFLL